MESSDALPSLRQTPANTLVKFRRVLGVLDASPHLQALPFFDPVRAAATHLDPYVDQLLYPPPTQAPAETAERLHKTANALDRVLEELSRASGPSVTAAYRQIVQNGPRGENDVPALMKSFVDIFGEWFLGSDPDDEEIITELRQDSENLSKLIEPVAAGVAGRDQSSSTRTT